MKARCIVVALALLFATSGYAETTRFCLEGEFDLGARYQGLEPAPGEFYPNTWCVISDDESGRALFSASGNSNPDVAAGWEVAYFPPDLVRIINRDSPPDLEFNGTDNADEARSVRRLDPHRLASEFLRHPERFDGMTVELVEGRASRFEATTDLPLRGRVPVVWHWTWPGQNVVEARLLVDGEVFFRATGRWKVLGESEAVAVWALSGDEEPIEIPGESWPARVAMELVNLADGTYLVRGVRSGFQHLVVDTGEGLVVADAPAGWVELHQLPPSDLVPGLGVSGLSERLVDFLNQEFDGRPIVAAAVTHMHDDHAGGARAFAAAGAKVYAPAAVESDFERALNRAEMPPDRLKRARASIDIVPVLEPVDIGAGENRVRLVPIGANPHVSAMLGVWAVDAGYFFVSDIHVPGSDAGAPSDERAATECWFARWAVEHLPETIRVLNSHSAVETPLTRLRNYLESDACN